MLLLRNSGTCIRATFWVSSWATTSTSATVYPSPLRTVCTTRCLSSFSNFAASTFASLKTVPVKGAVLVLGPQDNLEQLQLLQIAVVATALSPKLHFEIHVIVLPGIFLEFPSRIMDMCGFVYLLPPPLVLLLSLPPPLTITSTLLQAPSISCRSFICTR